MRLDFSCSKVQQFDDTVVVVVVVASYWRPGIHGGDRKDCCDDDQLIRPGQLMPEWWLRPSIVDGVAGLRSIMNVDDCAGTSPIDRNWPSRVVLTKAKLMKKKAMKTRKKSAMKENEQQQQQTVVYNLNQ